MWGALKSDFTEFVSTVTTEATDTLNSLDVKLDRNDNDGAPMVDMIDPDTGMSLDDTSYYQQQQQQQDGDNCNPPSPKSMSEMQAFLFEMDAVFLDPLSPEEQSAVSADMTVDLDSKTDEIASLLQTYPRLEAAFSRLADQVEYKDFWTRYFQRFGSSEVLKEDVDLDTDTDEAKSANTETKPKVSNPQILAKTYQKYYGQHQQEIHQKEMERAGNALRSVTSFLGGAVKRMIDENDLTQDDDEEEYIPANATREGNPLGTVSEVSGPTGPMRFFQTGTTRHPTPIDNNEDEDDDEEEELGWDDDDEDDDEDDDDEQYDNDENGSQEDNHQDDQIEFKDAEKERLQEELEQAMTERDMLHRTVELQTQELKKLREGVASEDETKQVEALKMEVFEKDSELAALRARLEDDNDPESNQDSTNAINEKITQLNDTIATLQTDIANRDAKLSELEEELQKASATQNTLASQEEVADLKEKLAAALTDLQSQSAILAEERVSKGDLLVKIEALNSDIANRDGKILQLEEERDKISKLAERDQEPKVDQVIDTLKQELLIASEQCKQNEAALADSKVEKQNLLDQLESMKNAMEGVLSESNSLQKEKKAWTSQQNSLLEAKEKELADALAELSTLRTECAAAKTKLANVVTTSPPSPSSSSTGVQVAPPPAVPIPEPDQPSGDNNDDTDADSDWGDW